MVENLGLNNSNNKQQVGSASFEQLLAKEILLSQQLRTSILSGIFALAFLVIIVLYGLSVLKGSAIPLLLPALALALMAHQLAIKYYIRHCVRLNSSIKKRFWYLNAFVEISIITIAVILLQNNFFINPVYGLSTPPVIGFCIFITLSTLLLDFRISVFTGAVAAIEYFGVVIYTLYYAQHDMNMDPLFLDFPIYIGKSFILLMVGLSAGFVARELKQRLIRTFHSVQDRDRMAEANQLKSQFLANMSHEIRTPLNAILGYGQILNSEAGLSVAQRRAVNVIQSSGKHLLDLINEVLDLSKIEAGLQELHPEKFSLSAMVDELKATFAVRCTEKNLALSIESNANATVVYGDQQKLRQVLMNLLSNAVKFTAAGSVRLEVCILPDNEVYFSVSDTGPGIPMERQAKLFEPFLQGDAGRKHGGTGLGLAIASQYVELMGGVLQVDSTPGKFTRFFFSLSLPEISGELQSATTMAVIQHLAPECRVNAIVLDDIAENREVLRWMLERIGVTVQTTASGEETLELLKQGLPDIIFSDIRMEGLSGLDTMQQIVTEYQPCNIKFVAVSASALAHERQEYMAAGFHAFLEKPVSMDDLYKCLAEVADVTYTLVDSVHKEAEHKKKLSSSVVLPVDILSAMKQAVTAHNMTKLRKLLSDIELRGLAEKELATELRRISAEYDMDALMEALNELRHG